MAGDKFTSLYDYRKNFYSSISIDNDHTIEITYDDMVNFRGELVSKKWWVQMINTGPHENLHECWFAIKSFDSLIEAKCYAFKLKSTPCKCCHDENGVKKKLR
jgi:hypothetical protein